MRRYKEGGCAHAVVLADRHSRRRHGCPGRHAAAAGTPLMQAQQGAQHGGGGGLGVLVHGILVQREHWYRRRRRRSQLRVVKLARVSKGAPAGQGGREVGVTRLAGQLGAAVAGRGTQGSTTCAAARRSVCHQGQAPRGGGAWRRMRRACSLPVVLQVEAALRLPGPQGQAQRVELDAGRLVKGVRKLAAASKQGGTGCQQQWKLPELWCGHGHCPLLI